MCYVTIHGIVVSALTGIEAKFGGTTEEGVIPSEWQTLSEQLTSAFMSAIKFEWNFELYIGSNLAGGRGERGPGRRTGTSSTRRWECVWTV